MYNDDDLHYQSALEPCNLHCQPLQSLDAVKTIDFFSNNRDLPLTRKINPFIGTQDHRTIPPS